VTIVEQPTEPRSKSAGALLASVAAGVLLGALDLAGQVLLPAPWSDLANSAAVWAAAAFALGRALRTHWLVAAMCGAVCLTVAVESYYLAAVIALTDSTENLTSPSTVTWLSLGVVAGLVFGAAGAWSRQPRDIPAAVATAAAAAVLFADALALRQTWGAAAGVSIVGVTVLVVAAGSTRRRWLALAASAPLTALALAAFAALGFGTA
jgi:hypothetical protein